jgi:hypothetical protein
MNDDDVFSLVRDRMTKARDDLGSVHMEQPASAVLHRASSRRRRHRLYGAMAGTGALGVALAVGLGTVGTGGGTAVGVAAGTPSATAKAVHVNLDAWSVNTAANGTVELTMRQLEDKAELERILAAAGVPAVVAFGGNCRAADGSHPSGSGLPHVMGRAVANHRNITIKPAAIPSGDELSIGIYYGPGGKKSGSFVFVFSLAPQGVALTCSPLRASGG